MRHAKPRLERAKQRVGRAGAGQAVVEPGMAGDDEERDPAAVDVRQTASRGVVVPLVPMMMITPWCR